VNNNSQLPRRALYHNNRKGWGDCRKQARRGVCSDMISCNFTHFTINFLFISASFILVSDRQTAVSPAPDYLKEAFDPLSNDSDLSIPRSCGGENRSKELPLFQTLPPSPLPLLVERGGGLILGAPCLKLHLIKHGPVCMGFGGLRTEKMLNCRLFRGGAAR
jgi:hypothetical protein